MDMKKILQAMDGAASKPDQGANDMKKFVSIINEGANPHKVSLPVQMAMQHYQQPVEKKPAREPLIGKFFKQVEEELVQEKAAKRQLINQYASVIAERVLMKESKINELSSEKLGQYKKAAGADASAADKAGDYERGNKRFKGIVKATKKQFDNDAKKGVAEGEIPGHSMGFTGGVGPGLQSNVAEEHNAQDTVTLDIPLLVRMLEYAREDAKTDIEIHDVVERMIHMSEEGRTLTMDDYNEICNVQQGVAESEQFDLRKLQQQWWVALPAIMKQAGIDYHPVTELSRDYYPTLGWITIPGESSSTFNVNANPKGDSAKLNISIDIDTSNNLYRDAQPERAAKLSAYGEKIAQALGGTAAKHTTGERRNHPGVSHITATMVLPKEPEEWQNPSRGYDPTTRFLNQPGELARRGRVARSSNPDSYGGDASNYRLEGVAEGYLPDESEMKTIYRAKAPDGNQWEVKEYQGDYLTFVNGEHNNTYHATHGMPYGAKDRAIEVVRRMAKQGVAEGRTIKPKKKSSPCWDGYQQLGMQNKDGKTVPKCVSKKK